MAEEIRPSVRKILVALRDEELDSLSHFGPTRGVSKRAPSHAMNLREVRALISAAFSSKRLRIASLRGSMVSARLHTATLQHIARELPGSRVVCLNVGEFTDASQESYEQLVSALPHSYVGNLYWHDPDPMAHTELKRHAMQALRGNRVKPFYRAQLLSDTVWHFLKHGCKAWYDAQDSTRDAARRKWDSTQPTDRCVRRCKSARCKAVNLRMERCCLCTRDASGYCATHRYYGQWT